MFSVTLRFQIEFEKVLVLEGNQDGKSNPVRRSFTVDRNSHLLLKLDLTQ